MWGCCWLIVFFWQIGWLVAPLCLLTRSRLNSASENQSSEKDVFVAFSDPMGSARIYPEPRFVHALVGPISRLFGDLLHTYCAILLTDVVQWLADQSQLLTRLRRINLLKNGMDVARLQKSHLLHVPAKLHQSFSMLLFCHTVFTH